MTSTQPSLHLDGGFVVWCYAPSDDLTSWHAPQACETGIGSAADAHHYARHLRTTYHGHLFAVLPAGRTPRLTR